MSIISFNYVKKGADTSQPKVMIPISKPSDKYFGIDITELDPEDQGEISAKLEKLQNTFSTEVENLMIDYDLKHCYRYFFEEKMSDVVIEE